VTVYRHQPDNPMANERGMVTLENYYQYKYMYEDDKRAVIGNQVVELQFITDGMNETWHPANGKYYTSKKRFRDETKARGCIEVGNEIKEKLKPRKHIRASKRQRRDDIKRALWEVRNGQNTYHGTEYENVFKKK